MKRDVIVVGGGAAGMMAALYAAREGAHVTLLEKNEKLGKKVYITGKGRCNVTNAAPSDVFMAHIYRNPRFMYRALALLDNRGLMDLVEELGTPLKIERGERVFPVSDHASDVIAALRRGLERAGVDLRYGVRVRELWIEDGVCRGVWTEDERLQADAVVVATGGLSYPSTGSTGDGYGWADQTGHALVGQVPSLVPLETVESWPALLMGLSLKNVRLTARAKVGSKEKKLFSEQGEMLFTHFGISGPLVLTLSELLPDDPSGIKLSIDLKPALDESMLNARLLRDFRELSRKQIPAVMDGLVPKALGRQMLVLLKIAEGTPVNAVTAQQRQALVALMKNLPLTVSRRRGFDEAIITRGGVSVKDIDPATMQSRRISGLYFSGEMIDVDAATGGFNLQIAFSTGALAGQSAARASVNQ